jgi:hypothetical protein
MFLDREIDRSICPDNGLDGERVPMDFSQRLGKGVRGEKDYGAAGTQSGLDLGRRKPVIQRK